MFLWVCFSLIRVSLYDLVGMSWQRHTGCRQGLFLGLFRLPNWALLAGGSAWNKLPQPVWRGWAGENPGTQVPWGCGDEASLQGKSCLWKKGALNRNTHTETGGPGLTQCVSSARVGSVSGFAGPVQFETFLRRPNTKWYICSSFLSL